MKTRRASRYSTVLAVALSILGGIASGAPTHVVKFTPSGYTGAEALANFPVLVRLTEGVAGFSYAHCAADGKDLSFKSWDGTSLPREIEKWNASGESLVWVLIPSLTSTTSFYALYGDASVTEQPASQTNGTV